MTQIPIFNFSNYTINKKGFIRLVTFSDEHIGLNSCDEKALLDAIDYVWYSNKNKEPVYWCQMGDWIENITKDCIAPHYEQRILPTQQVEMVMDYFGKIKNYGLFAIGGNHELRTKKRAYYDMLVGICNRLGIKYMGLGGYVRLNVINQQYILCVHHGFGAGANWELEINKLRRNYPLADIYYMAHNHALEMKRCPYIAISKEGTETEAYYHACRCGQFIGFPTYAKEANYAKQVVGALVTKFHGREHLISGFKLEYINSKRILDR